MKFKHNLVYDNAQEVEYLINSDYEFSCLVVDVTLENLTTRKKVIPIVSVYAQDEDMIFDFTVDREDMENTLYQNLPVMETFEDYERCQQIVDGIKFIKNKANIKNNGNKTKNKR